MSGLFSWLLSSVGRRGLVLAVIGMIWTFYGLGIFLGGGPALLADASGVWHLSLVTPETRGLVWTATGALALWTTVSRPRTDTAGFLALSVGPMITAASYLTSWVVWALPLGEPGYSQGLVNGLSWLSVLALVVICASWPEPTEERPTGPAMPPEVPRD